MEIGKPVIITFSRPKAAAPIVRQTVEQAAPKPTTTIIKETKVQYVTQDKEIKEAKISYILPKKDSKLSIIPKAKVEEILPKAGEEKNIPKPKVEEILQKAGEEKNITKAKVEEILT